MGFQRLVGTSNLALALPLAAQTKLTVGAIYVGSVHDYGYNEAMHDGLMAMKKAIPGVTLLEAENVPETAESTRIMEGMIQHGAKLIFATSFGHQQFAFNLAKKHPDVVFEHADRILVLNRGALIAEGAPAAVRANRDVQAVYLGAGARYEARR